MTKPLALLLHEKPLPGSQVASRFAEMEYRVVTLAEPDALLETARREMPMIVVADLNHRWREALAAIKGLRSASDTSHLPVLGYAAREDGELCEEALGAGVKIVATDAMVVHHLPQVVEQALQVD